MAKAKLITKGLIFFVCTLLSPFNTITATPTIEEPQQMQTDESESLIPNLDVTGYTLINQSSNTILASQNDQVKLPPASLTKLMTLFIAYDYIDKGLINPHEKVHISKKAWKVEGSRMFIEPNSEVELDLLLKGISVVSGNDASIAVAEHIAGTEKNFVKIMNKKARELKLHNTHFENSTGLPHPKHLSTPHDMSILASNLIRQHPTLLKHTKDKTMTYKKITQQNRNKLLWSDETVFGLKTGHTREAGYCLIASAERDNQIIIATVFGAKSEKSRDIAIKKLLNHAQNGFQNITIADDKKIPNIPVWYGQEKQIKPKMQSRIQLSVPLHMKQKIRSQVNLPKELKAPLEKGQIIGNYEIYTAGKLTHKTNLISAEAVKPQNSVRQLLEWIIYQAVWLLSLFGRSA